LTIAVLVNTGSGAGMALSIAASIARPLLGLPAKKPPADLTVPPAELAQLTGTFDSDEGTVEIFAADGKLHFRDLPSKAEGLLLRQSENVYAVGDDLRVRFMVRGGRADWSMVYTGGLFMDAARRMP
jgi:hypothetical protein